MGALALGFWREIDWSCLPDVDLVYGAIVDEPLGDVVESRELGQDWTRYLVVATFIPRDASRGGGQVFVNKRAVRM